VQSLRRHERTLWITGLVVGVLMIVAAVAHFEQEASANAAYQEQQKQLQLQQKLAEQVKVENAINLSAGSLHPILTVTARDAQGRVYARYVDKNDLMLNNFINMLACIFSDQFSFTFTTTTNTVNAEVCHGSSGLTLGNDVSFAAGSLIQTGTGTTAAARTDIAIQTPFQSAVTVLSAMYDTNTGNATASVSFTASTGYTMTEAGLMYTQANVNYLLFHDVFTGIVISTGSAVAVQYTLELLTTGFTNSFGALLGCLFSYGAQNTAVSFAATDTGGTARTLRCATPSSPNAQTFAGDNAQGSQTNIISWMEVGTGTTAVSRSATYLTTAACGGTATGQTGLTGFMNPTVYSVTQIKVSRPVTCTSATSVTEAAELTDWFDVNTAVVEAFMLWRQTFTAVSVGANQAVTPALTITVN